MGIAVYNADGSRRISSVADNVIELSSITANATVTANTVYTTSVAVIAGTARDYEAVQHLFEFWGPGISGAPSPGTSVALYDGTTHIANLCQSLSAGGGNENTPAYGAIVLTPTAASHTYNIRAYNNNATAGTVYAGTGGGAGVNGPAYFRITRL